MSLSGNLDAFIPPPCFSIFFGFVCLRGEELRGTFVFDDFVITSADPTIRVVETSFNALLTGSVFVFAINPGTEAVAQVFVTFRAADCSDSPSASYEECVQGNGSLIQVAQNNNLTVIARNTTGPLSSVFGSGAFAPLNEPGLSLATTFTIPVDLPATSPTFFAPVGRPFSVGLAVDTEMQVFFPVPFAGQSPVFGRVNIDFGDPISFPATGPVFNLPAGFTVNSPRAGVVNNRFVGAGAPPDTTPPTTLAVPSPPPNANGWNNTNVTVALSATDNPGGSGVKEIRFSESGAQGGAGVVPGANAAVTISAEGTTTLTFFAVDNAGNQEAAKTFTVRIDTTPPVIAGLPAAGCTLWPPNHRLVQVGTVTASDSVSGIAPGSLMVTGASNEGANGLGQGNSAQDILITGSTVKVRAERSGTATGRIYTLTASASDLAGNRATATATCTVAHDQR
jgi:hypothetical protein